MCCTACGGVYHPDTGHRFTETAVLCGPCTRDMVKFVKGRMALTMRGARFYEHALRGPSTAYEASARVAHWESIALTRRG